MEKLTIESKIFDGYAISLPNSTLLLIKGSKGVLGCGYFDIEVANKVNEVIAVVSGVKNFDDMLSARVVKVSRAAIEEGISLGMSGKAALLKMNQ